MPFDDRFASPRDADQDVLDLTAGLMIAPALDAATRRARAWIVVERGARFAVIATAAAAAVLALLALAAPARAQTFDGLFDTLASGGGAVIVADDGSSPSACVE